MKKTRDLVLGLGNYGRSWAYVAAKNPEGELVAVVDRSEEALALVDLPVAKYTDLDTAVAEQKPDVVILVLPPHLHIPVARGLMEKGITVLCEKPICSDLKEAADFTAWCAEQGRPCGIAENYRYRPVMRGAKQLLLDGVVGKIRRVNCRFTHYHPDYSMFYHGSLKHPLLNDVTVHHLDLARYLTGAEPLTVTCTEHGAPHCWYQQRPASAEIASEMTEDIFFTYNGTLASPVSTTDWYGDWEIMGDKAVLRICGTTVTLYTAENEKQVWEFPDGGDTRAPLLSGFIRALQENTFCESDIQDNFKTFHWMQTAAQSAECGEEIKL